MICAVYGENEKNFQALTAGASDYILKKTAPVQILGPSGNYMKRRRL